MLVRTDVPIVFFTHDTYTCVCITFQASVLETEINFVYRKKLTKFEVVADDKYFLELLQIKETLKIR